MKKWMRALGVALTGTVVGSTLDFAEDATLHPAPPHPRPMAATAYFEPIAPVFCLAISIILLANVFANGAQAQDSTDTAATYGNAVASMCKPAESVASCNARLTLIGTTIEKLHELAPTGILKGAYLAADPAGKPVICAYGWENNIVSVR